MNKDKLIQLIDTALSEADNYVAKYYNGNEQPVLDTKRVLNLLKSEVQHDPVNINERVLRAMHDTGMASYKDYENTPLEDAINHITEMLYNEIPRYKNLQPLRMDFGRGNPI